MCMGMHGNAWECVLGREGAGEGATRNWDLPGWENVGVGLLFWGGRC